MSPMIDTVKRHVSGSWKVKESAPPGWELRRSDVLEVGKCGQVSKSALFLTHRETGLRVWGGENSPGFIEASLPRQVFASNGQLLAKQDEVEQAHAAMADRLARVVDVESLGSYTRIDCVWQFKGKPSAWVQALSGARWPYVRSASRVFFDESIEWSGDRVGLRIYDKVLEQTRKRGGDVVRVELQTKSKALKDSREKTADFPINRIGSFVHGCASGLPIDLLYPWYRGHVVKLPAFGYSVKTWRWSSFLYYLDAEGVIVEGRKASDIWLEGRSRTTAYRLRKQMAEHAARDLIRVDMQELLPEHCLPPVVHCIAAA